MRRSKLLSIGLPMLGVGSLLVGGVLVILGKPSIPAEEPTITPVTSPAAKGIGTARSFVGAVGVVEPPSELIEIGSHRSGVVREVFVAINSTITPGSPLFQIDDRAIRAEIAIREADLQRAISTRDELLGQIPVLLAQADQAAAEITTQEAALSAAEAEIARARAELRERENQLRIGRGLIASKAIAEDEVIRRENLRDQAEAMKAAAIALHTQAAARLQAAIARREEAQAQLHLITKDDGTPGPRLIAQEVLILTATNQLRATETELDLHTVRSPIKGEVLQSRVRPGQFAQAGSLAQPLLIIGSTDRRMLRIQIDEADLPRFNSNARATASPRGRSTQRYDLTFDRIEPLIRPKTELSGNVTERVDTRILEVVYAFDEDPNLPLPFFGQQFDVFIEAARRE